MKSIFAYLVIVSNCFCFSIFAQNYVSEQITVTSFQKSIKRAGKVAFKRTLKLSFKSSGFLEKLSVDEGDTFSSNQLLASLNTEELKAEKNSRYAQLLQAKREVRRTKKLLEQNLSSERELELAQTNVETSREAYQVAYYNLEKAEVYAPFNGVVLSRKAELKEFQVPGKEILEVAAIENNLIVKVSLTDKEIGFVTQGQQVQVTTLNLGALRGTISKVPVTSNTDGQLYMIEIILDGIKAGQGIVAGQQAQVNIEFSNESFVYKVPIEALNEVDKTGAAVLMTQESGDRFTFKRFDVLNIDNEYLYLKAKNPNTQLNIIVSGWQQLRVDGK